MGRLPGRAGGWPSDRDVRLSIKSEPRKRCSCPSCLEAGRLGRGREALSVMLGLVGDEPSRPCREGAAPAQRWPCVAAPSISHARSLFRGNTWAQALVKQVKHLPVGMDGINPIPPCHGLSSSVEDKAHQWVDRQESHSLSSLEKQVAEAFTQYDLTSMRRRKNGRRGEGGCVNREENTGSTRYS